MGGKRHLALTSTLSEIDKNPLGMNLSSKKSTGGSKNSAGRGHSGQIELGGAPPQILKSKSIHGSKVSEVTVQANQVKHVHLRSLQQPSFHSTMSTK